MNMNMRIVEAEGYSKEKAYKETGLNLNPELIRNATVSWKKAGAPTNTKELREFFENYFKKEKVPGIMISITPASDDTRQRPYTVVNEVTEGRRKTTTVYQIKEAVLKSKVKEVVSENEDGEEVTTKDITVKVESTGLIVGKAATKGEAMKIMRDLIRDNQRNYVIEIAKEVTEGQPYAAYGLYTPSSGAKVGKFIFATLEQ